MPRTQILPSLARSLFCPLALGALLSGCGGGPASVSFDDVKEDGMVFYSADPVPLPRATFKDKDGKAVEPPKDLKWEVTPSGVVKLQGDQLVPLKNGNAMLILRAGKLKAKTTLGVSLVDKISLRCSPRSCTVPPGETLTFSADAEVDGSPVVGPKLKWSVSDDKIFKMTSPGKFTGLKAGQAQVTVSLGQLQTVHRAFVKNPVDEIIVTCPKPKLTFSMHRKRGERSPKEACHLKRGRKMELGWKVLAAGEEDPVRHPDWRSGNRDVATVLGGVVTGVKNGATVIEATVDALTIRVPVSIE